MTVLNRSGYPLNNEQSITRRFADACLRDRTVRPEYPIGTTLTPKSPSEQYEGFGVKYGDLAGVHTNKPTLVEVRPRHTAEDLYSGLGQAVVKRALLAREHDLATTDIETYVLFDSGSFDTVDALPEMAWVIAEVMASLDIEWVIPDPNPTGTRRFLRLQEVLV